ncbi:MAG: hypothetical protein L0G23_10325 [Ruaniaceae bacterium]|nr:hypothetical protein [Ruaniaceae bacterium]
MTGYHLPGLYVEERTVSVPLDWSDPDGAQIEVFVREIVDTDRRGDELRLLIYLQGGPGGANPRPLERSGWLDEAKQNGTGSPATTSGRCGIGRRSARKRA